MTVAVEIELIEPGSPLFHVALWGPWRDLYLFRDEAGEYRSATARAGLPRGPLPRAWLAALPPLGDVMEAAFPLKEEIAA
jgi:hypothetical protein